MTDSVMLMLFCFSVSASLRSEPPEMYWIEAAVIAPPAPACLPSLVTIPRTADARAECVVAFATRESDRSVSPQPTRGP
mgnify:CR=1 FL=1